LTKNPSGNNPSGRRHERTKMRARLKMIHPQVGDLIVFIADISDGGLFILHGGHTLPDIGELIKVQIQGLPVEAPVLTAKIMRKTDEGIGVMFLNGDSE